MENKRQAEIKEFFIREFGAKKGSTLFEKQELLFRTLIGRQKGKSKNQMKTLTQTIMPVIAMYRVIAELETDKDNALHIVGANKNESMNKMEKVPGFFTFIKKYF